LYQYFLTYLALLAYGKDSFPGQPYEPLNLAVDISERIAAVSVEQKGRGSADGWW
jgi:hypothetical protein